MTEQEIRERLMYLVKLANPEATEGALVIRCERMVDLIHAPLNLGVVAALPDRQPGDDSSDKRGDRPAGGNDTPSV
jgi:hypothetical protein